MAIRGFEIAGGSITGRDHLGRNEVLIGRNNQDAFLWNLSDHGLVAVVCDGCGSSTHTEVGAKLGARLITTAIAEKLERLSPQHPERSLDYWQGQFLERIRLDTLARLRVLALEMAGPQGSLTEIVRDYFLFTVVGLILTESQALVFAIGDGLYCLNGDASVLGPFADNQPPYLAYGLIADGGSNDLPAGSLRFKVHRLLPTEKLTSILIGTDGTADLKQQSGAPLPGTKDLVGSLAQFWQDDRYFANPDAIRRRLALINREVRRLDPAKQTLLINPGLLHDDTTLVAVRRIAPAPTTAPCR